jgi:hypothetical protein
MKASMIFRRLASFFCLMSEVGGRHLDAQVVGFFGRSMPLSISRIASAPIMAVKLSSPYSSCARRYSSSDSSWYGP